MDVRATIRAYLQKAAGVSIEDDDDIFERGVVDSLFALQLVTFVENEFDFITEREELDIRNFSSISSLTAFVETKLSQGQPPSE